MEIRDLEAAYRFEEVVSASPLSTVRKAVDPGSGQLVAVKILKPLGATVTPTQRERFLSVMRRLTELQLAALPEVLDFGFAAGDSAFVVTSFVEGTPLTRLGPVGEERMVPILADLARALEVLANNGLVHHNLCPENVLVVESPGGETVQLLGLGTVAYLAADSGEAPLGRSPEAERFAAAELLVPRALVHPLAWRADLYSFALLTCELLGAEVAGLGSPAPRVSFPATLRHGGALAEQLAIALRRDPEARTTTFAELRRLLLSRPVPESRGSASPAPPPGQADIEATIQMELPAPAPAPAAPARPAIKVKVGGRELPEPPRAQAHQEPVEAMPPAGGPEPVRVFDPNKTDPLLVVPEMPAAGAGAPPPPVSENAAASPPAREEPKQPLPPPPPPVPTPVSAPPPPSPHVAVPSSPSEPAAKPAPPARRPPAPTSRPRWRVAALALGALLLVAGLGVVATILMDPGPVPLIVVPTPAPPTPAPTAAPRPPLESDPQLLAARDAMEDGDFDAARRILEGIPPERLATLSPADAALARALKAELEGMSREKAIDDLTQGLRTGNMRALRAAVDALVGMSAQEQAAVPGLREQLAKANEALRVSAQITRAQRSGDWLEVLQRSVELIAILPTYQRAVELRDQATRALLAEADEHVQGRRWDRAISRLDLIARAWPEAPGVAERLARARHDKAVEEKARRLLAEANSALEAGNPEAGLAALASFVPPPHFSAAFEEARERLQARLAELDAQPPTVSIPAGFEPRFKKNEVLTVPVRISDDYRLASAKAFVRTEERTSYREIQLKHVSGDEYVLEISPAVHANASVVQLYIVATDPSGHSSSFGTAGKPYEIKRKRLFGR